MGTCPIRGCKGFSQRRTPAVMGLCPHLAAAEPEEAHQDDGPKAMEIINAI